MNCSSQFILFRGPVYNNTVFGLFQTTVFGLPHLIGFEIAQLEFHHLLPQRNVAEGVTVSLKCTVLCFHKPVAVACHPGMGYQSKEKEVSF